MSAKHTPGPWVVDPPHYVETGLVQEDADGRVGYHIIEAERARYRLHLAACITKADANLIGAAPDLLVALELTIHVLEGECERTRDAMERYPDDPNGPGALADDEKILRMARAAIAKAEGES